jgi:hypothetical protein
VIRAYCTCEETQAALGDSLPCSFCWAGGNDEPMNEDNFQSRTLVWLRACWPNTASTPTLERVDRFLEEALELAQAQGYPRERIATLVNYVYDRPIGEPSSEVGGVMVTLAALCGTAGLDMHDAGEAELARVSTPEKMARLRAKNAGWDASSPLPGGAHPVEESNSNPKETNDA